jgi:hypothetical protein
VPEDAEDAALLAQAVVIGMVVGALLFSHHWFPGGLL